MQDGQHLVPMLLQEDGRAQLHHGDQSARQVGPGVPLPFTFGKGSGTGQGLAQGRSLFLSRTLYRGSGLL